MQPPNIKAATTILDLATKDTHKFGLQIGYIFDEEEPYEWRLALQEALQWVATERLDQTDRCHADCSWRGLRLVSGFPGHARGMALVF